MHSHLMFTADKRRHCYVANPAHVVMDSAVPAHADPKTARADEINSIIHQQGKVHYGSACYPCRQRKVKCDNKIPCQNCLKRNYPNLCSDVPKTSGEHDIRESHATKRQKMSISGDGKQRSDRSSSWDNSRWKSPHTKKQDFSSLSEAVG